jgi:hypothetical protein
MSEVTPEALVERGRRAEAIVKDPIVTEAFEQLRKSLLEAIPLTKAHETEERERLYAAATIVSDLHAAFNVIVNTGKLTQAKLEAIKKARK